MSASRPVELPGPSSYKSRTIDCACFRLHVPDRLTVNKAVPSRMSAFASGENSRLGLEIRVEKKTRKEKWLMPFRLILGLRWFFLHTYEGHRRKLSIGRHTALIAFHRTEEDFYFDAAINLDRSHFLAFHWRSPAHPSATDTPAVDDSCDPLRILTSLQLLGNYADAWQTTRDRDNEMLAAKLRKHQKNYTSAAEQAADPFHARQHPVLFAKLQKRLRKYPDLQPYLDGIYTNARLAIGFVATRQDDYQTKGNTRFGGLPDLPPDAVWPVIDTERWPLQENQGVLSQFIAQINCADLNGMQAWLPAHGMLYFFIGPHAPRTDDREDGRFCKVLYYGGTSSSLKSARELDIQPDALFDFRGEAQASKPARTHAFPHVSILHSANGRVDYPPQNCPRYTSPIDGEEPFCQIEALNAALTGKPYKTLHAINANISENFAFSSSPYAEAAKALGGKAQDYAVLLRVGSEKKISGLAFGDDGYLYFLIAKEKLRNRDFSQVYCSIEFIDYDWD